MPKGKLTFDYEKCKGCMLCVEVCPTHILSLDKVKMNEKGYRLINITDIDKCIACGFCAVICPDSVISVEKVKK